jgi:uncharacterized linocin/CFP29 family protein
VLEPLTPAAMFLVATIDEGGEPQVHDALADISGLVRAIGFRDPILAPAIDGAFVLSTRGGDFDLQLGSDVSIGYLSHNAETVELYLEETLTFLCYTA